MSRKSRYNQIFYGFTHSVAKKDVASFCKWSPKSVPSANCLIIQRKETADATSVIPAIDVTRFEALVICTNNVEMRPLSNIIYNHSDGTITCFLRKVRFICRIQECGREEELSKASDEDVCSERTPAFQMRAVASASAQLHSFGANAGWAPQCRHVGPVAAA